MASKNKLGVTVSRNESLRTALLSTNRTQVLLLLPQKTPLHSLLRLLQKYQQALLSSHSARVSSVSEQDLVGLLLVS